MKTRIYGILLAFAMAFVVLAADPSGKWTYETQGRNGPQTVTLTLSASGGSLTGSIAGGRGGEVNISDGKVDGDNISFHRCAGVQRKLDHDEIHGKAGRRHLESDHRGAARRSANSHG